jgi:hypothetical protein
LTWKPQLPPAGAPTDASALRREIKAERQARIEAAVAAGKAVRDPPIVVGIADPNKNYAAIYKDADGILHYPGPLVVTGVPRSGRDDGLEVPTSSSTPSWVVETKPVEKLPPLRPQPTPELPVEGPRHPVRWTARLPDEKGSDPGQIIRASYSVTDNVLRTYDDEDDCLGRTSSSPATMPFTRPGKS